MDTAPLSVVQSIEQRRARQRAFADAAQKELTGAWLAVRPRRRRIGAVQEIAVLAINVEKDQPSQV